MITSINQFRTNIARIRQNLSLYPTLVATVGAASDMSDFLRGELAASVSCFDYYIHELVRTGVLEILQARRPRTVQYNAFQVSLGGAMDVQSQAVAAATWLDGEIRQKNGWKSFQRDDKVADIMKLISNQYIWEEVARKMNLSAEQIRKQLNTISDRRNQIVHEFDQDPSAPGSRWPIDDVLVSDTVDFLSNIGENIFDIVKI